MNPIDDQIDFDFEELDTIIGESPIVSPHYFNVREDDFVSQLLLKSPESAPVSGRHLLQDENQRNHHQPSQLTNVPDRHVASGILPLDRLDLSEKPRKVNQNSTCDYMKLDIAAIEDELEMDSITNELEDLSSALNLDQSVSHSINLPEHWGSSKSYPTFPPERHPASTSNRVGMLLPMTHTVTPHHLQHSTSSERMHRLLLGLSVPALHNLDEHLRPINSPEREDPTPRTTTSMQIPKPSTMYTIPSHSSDQVADATADNIMSQIDLIRIPSGGTDFSERAPFSPPSSSIPRPAGTPQPKLRYSEGATASHYCHICGRASNTAQLAACANVKLGLCRKTLCEKCLLLHQRELFSWAKASNSTWTCTHCRGVCPKRARCHQYQRNNMRRKLQNAKRSDSVKNEGRQVAETPVEVKRVISKSSNTPKDKTSKRKMGRPKDSSFNLTNSRTPSKSESKETKQGRDSHSNAAISLIADWRPENMTPKGTCPDETVKDIVDVFNSKAAPFHQDDYSRALPGQWSLIPQEYDYEKGLTTSTHTNYEALEDLFEERVNPLSHSSAVLSDSKMQDERSSAEAGGKEHDEYNFTVPLVEK